MTSTDFSTPIKNSKPYNFSEKQNSIPLNSPLHSEKENITIPMNSPLHSEKENITQKNTTSPTHHNRSPRNHYPTHAHSHAHAHPHGHIPPLVTASPLRPQRSPGPVGPAQSAFIKIQNANRQTPSKYNFVWNVTTVKQGAVPAPVDRSPVKVAFSSTASTVDKSPKRITKSLLSEPLNSPTIPFKVEVEELKECGTPSKGSPGSKVTQKGSTSKSPQEIYISPKFQSSPLGSKKKRLSGSMVLRPHSPNELRSPQQRSPHQKSPRKLSPNEMKSPQRSPKNLSPNSRWTQIPKYQNENSPLLHPNTPTKINTNTRSPNKRSPSGRSPNKRSPSNRSPITSKLRESPLKSPLKGITSPDSGSVQTVPVEDYDYFGFLKSNSNANSQEDSHFYIRPEDSKITLWNQIMENRKDWEDGRLQYLLFFEGLPDTLRANIWLKMLEVEKFKESCDFTYESLVEQEGTSEYCTQIRLDLKRTFANHKFFKTSEGRDKLFNILKAYSIYNKEVGYCQGMSYVCATLLIQLEEKQTFWAFTKLMETFHPFYHPSMAALVEGNNVFWKLLKCHNPTVHAHLETLQAQVMIFVTKWYLTLFTDLNNWRTVLRLWDIIIYEGKMSVHKIGLALFKCCSEEIMNCTSIETLVPLMLNIPKNKVDTQTLLAAVYEIDMTKLMSQMESDVATPPVVPTSSKPSLLNYVNQIFSDSHQSGIRKVFSKKPPHINNASPLMERKESRNGFRLSFGFLRNSSGTPKTRTPAQTPPSSNSRAGSPQKVMPTVSQGRAKRPSQENSHSSITELNSKTKTPSVSASSTSSNSTSDSISTPLTSPTAFLKGGNTKGFQSSKLSENNA